MKIRVMTVSIAILLFAASCYGADLKIGFVDMDYILKNSKEVLNAKGKLREKFNRLQEDLRTKESALKASMEEFKTQSALYSPEAKKEKEAELKKEEDTLVNTFKEYQEDIKKNEQELVKSVIDRVGEISQEQGYTFVIEKNSGFVVYASDDLNISKKMIEILDTKKEEEK